MRPPPAAATTAAPTFIEIGADLEPHQIAQAASSNQSHGLADGLYAVNCDSAVPIELLEAVADVNSELRNVTCVRAYSQVTSFLTMYLTIEGLDDGNSLSSDRNPRLVRKECKVQRAQCVKRTTSVALVAL